nr:rRNA N6-adenosine-methyltransferase ZCCHC4-like [Cherax quadricarinatus]
MANSDRLGVDVIINDLKNNPSCVHGPTVLFERFLGNGHSRKFYSCSTCRDRRDCGFFHLADGKITSCKRELWARLVIEAAPILSHQERFKIWKTVKRLPASDRSYCSSCSSLLKKSDMSDHGSCAVISPISDEQLSHPSTILVPKESSKFEAQYLFATSSVSVIVGMLQNLNTSRVLCIGAPRVHEEATMTTLFMPPSTVLLTTLLVPPSFVSFITLLMPPSTVSLTTLLVPPSLVSFITLLMPPSPVSLTTLLVPPSLVSFITLLMPPSPVSSTTLLLLYSYIEYMHLCFFYFVDVLDLFLFILFLQCSFFSPKQFIQYNMFNHHFFEGETAKNTYEHFISVDENLVIVTDPPFGGRMELLAHNLKQIQDDWRRSRGLDSHRELPVVFVFHNSVLFVFPYFMEQQVISSLPSFTMLDYQVDYDNHPLYSSGPKGMKNGSAVRVFVNLPQSMFPLPEESYHLCKVCDRWVSINNQHCDKCNGCMSKDGRTYKHCDGCNKCVKPSWVHCSDCSRCQPHDHRCQEAGSALTCHMCGHSGHKRMDCPKRKLGCTLSDDESKRKRRKRNKNTLPLSLEDERMRRKRNKNTLPLSLEDERKRNMEIFSQLT